MIELRFHLEPFASQSVRQGKSWSGRKIFYQPEEVKAYKANIIAATKNQIKDLPYFEMFPRSCPLSVMITYCFQYRKKERKKYMSKLPHRHVPKITWPDVNDNLQKPLMDALAGIVFEQDQQIFDIRARKFWWREDLITVSITPYLHKDHL